MYALPTATVPPLGNSFPSSLLGRLMTEKIDTFAKGVGNVMQVALRALHNGIFQDGITAATDDFEGIIELKESLEKTSKSPQGLAAAYTLAAKAASCADSVLSIVTDLSGKTFRGSTEISTLSTALKIPLAVKGVISGGQEIQKLPEHTPYKRRAFAAIKAKAAFGALMATTGLVAAFVTVSFLPYLLMVGGVVAACLDFAEAALVAKATPEKERQASLKKLLEPPKVSLARL